MLVSKNAKICVTPKVNAKSCVTPNVKPQRESVEYRLCWVPNVKFSRLPFCLSHGGNCQELCATIPLTHIHRAMGTLSETRGKGGVWGPAGHWL